MPILVGKIAFFTDLNLMSCNQNLSINAQVTLTVVPITSGLDTI